MIQRLLMLIAALMLGLGMATVMPACEESTEDKANDAAEEVEGAADEAEDALNETGDALNDAVN